MKESEKEDLSEARTGVFETLRAPLNSKSQHLESPPAFGSVQVDTACRRGENTRVCERPGEAER